MPRRRYISTEISSDRSIANLAKEYGDFAAMLYTWLIPHAEDDGCVYGDVGKIALLVLPGFRWKTDEDITHALEGMNKYGLVAWEPEQDTIRFPSSFFKYQSYIGKGRKAKAENKHSTPQNTAGQDNNTACESDTAEHRETPQNTANLESAGETPQNTPSLSSSSSFSFKSSSSSLKNNTPLPPCEGGAQSEASPSPRRKRDKREAGPPKTKYADFVSMTNDEYTSLVAKLGEHGALRCVEILDNYKGANGKKYASDYRAILNWVVTRYEEERQKGDAQHDNSNSGRDGQGTRTYDMSRFHNALDDYDDDDGNFIPNANG